MKKQLFLLAFLAHLCVARAAEPPVTVFIEPQEGLNLVYAPMGALSGAVAPTGRLWFKLKIQNTDAPQLTLTSIRVTLGALDVSIPRNLPCPGNSTTSDALTHAEVITIPHPAAAVVTIRLYFAGNITPKTLLSNFAPYTPTTPGGQYLYPADEGDIGPNEYFSDGLAHTVEESQAWGADWKVYRIISKGNYSTIRAGGDDTVNEDHLGWGVPIRAIADGVVLRTSTGWINNPTAGTRAFQKMAEIDGEAISDVKVTRLGATPGELGQQRAASFVRLADDAYRITIWNISNNGRVITRLGSSVVDPAETVTGIAMDALSSTRLVTSLRLTNNTHRLVLWSISEDGYIITRLDDLDDVAVTEVSLMKMPNTLDTRIASGVRTTAGDLRVCVFVRTNNDTLQLRGANVGGAATSICTTALGATRLATSLRTADGALKVIVWDQIEDSPYLLLRRGEATASNISRVAATWNDGGKWVTAARTSPGGVIELARWSASEDGMTLTPELITTTTQSITNTALDVAPGTGSGGTDNATTASVIAGGTFKINGWGDPDVLPGTYNYSAQNTAGTVTHVSLDETDTVDYFAGVRTTGGNLKVMTWHWGRGGGNNVVVRHGNCRVLYAHFLDGSVDLSVIKAGAPVLAGQVLGRMGNSGSSGAPHTHINSDRLEDGYTDQQYIDADALYALTGDTADLLIVAPRPMPFSGARAMQLSEISPGGELGSGNSFATMNGVGMYDVSLGIRPRLNTRYVDPTIIYAAPNGRKEPVPGNPATGGPMPIPSMALGGVPSGGRLYIRGRSYDEAITFSTRMIVRRYDYYETGGPVIIGK